MVLIIVLMTEEDAADLHPEPDPSATRRLLQRFRPRRRSAGAQLSYLLACSRLDAVSRVVEADCNPQRHWPELRPEDVLSALSMMAEARSDVDQYERQLLRAARRYGLSWSQIAGALSLDSLEAAQHRYRTLGADSAQADATPRRGSVALGGPGRG
jgi:membrane-bound lytic murein transglycosylase B